MRKVSHVMHYLSLVTAVSYDVSAIFYDGLEIFGQRKGGSESASHAQVIWVMYALTR